VRHAHRLRRRPREFRGPWILPRLRRPVAQRTLAEEPLLFGCGAAVLFRRDVFEAAGGWDEGTFAYYEDVELGWRLWLLGHEVWFAPDAVVHHRHHGTSGGADPARQRAFDRNALRMLYTHLEDATLQRVFPAALLLAADRALLSTPFSRAGTARTPLEWLRARLRPGSLKPQVFQALSRRGARRDAGVIGSLRALGMGGLIGAAAQVGRELAYSWKHRGAREQYLLERTPFGGSAVERESIPIEAVATLAGIADMLASLPELSAKRASLQAMRRRSDAEILERFGSHWLNHSPSAQQRLHATLREIVVQALCPRVDA
jgi:hypothetical protein